GTCRLMVRVKVKICCMADPGEAAMAAAAGAEYIGLVGPMPSGPGTLTLEDAAEIARSAPPSATPVLLSSATTALDLVREAEAAGAGVIQIVQHVSPGIHAELVAQAPGLECWQVIHVEDRTAVDLIRSFDEQPDAFLLDSGRPARGELGGTGRVHDWAISRDCVAATARPVFLAGGLTPENVGEAIRQVRPQGVDLCTGVRLDGRLNAVRLATFMQIVSDAGGGTGT
ncbi:MAG: phosphoribosylanthranilate isomerase, partial [Pseudomonadota bacterium]